MGWLIVLEYGVAGATVAVGFSRYFVSLLADFGLHVPEGLSTPLVQVPDAGTGHVSITGYVHLVAAAIIMLVTIPLPCGALQSGAENRCGVAPTAGTLVVFVMLRQTSSRE